MHCLGWADDSQLPNKRPDSADAWQTGFGGGAYTTGRRGRSRAPLPALPPGKINLSDYNHVSAALGRLQVCFFVRKISCSQCKLISQLASAMGFYQMYNVPSGSFSNVKIDLLLDGTVTHVQSQLL